DAYLDQLAARIGKGEQVMRIQHQKAKVNPKRVVFGEGEHPKIVRAAYAVEAEGIALPILLGREEVIQRQCKDLGLNYTPTVINPNRSQFRQTYADAFYQ
ncbi:phosphate acyltransferase, partial [Arthrospira platensis SPKY2]